jgi:hypothetical protein
MANTRPMYRVSDEYAWFIDELNAMLDDAPSGPVDG